VFTNGIVYLIDLNPANAATYLSGCRSAGRAQARGRSPAARRRDDERASSAYAPYRQLHPERRVGQGREPERSRAMLDCRRDGPPGGARCSGREA
jgi:hypothetical protein